MKIIQLILVLLVTLSLGACKKGFLEVDNGRILYRQEYVNNLVTLQEYLNGIYVDFGSTVVFHGYEVIYPEVIADNIKPNISATTSTFSLHYLWSQQAGNVNSRATNMNAFSYSAYKLIRSCNFVLETVDKYNKENEEKANTIKGEALAFRAYLHLSLCNFFAQQFNFTNDGGHPGVAYVTSSDFTDPVVRHTVSEVYSKLIDDLNNAILLLPETRLLSTGKSTKLLISRVTAKAILARAYLFKGDFVNAKNLARDVIGSIPLMTQNYPTALFTSNETEAIFQIEASSQNSTSFAGRYLTGSATSTQFLATMDIVDILTENPGDKRKVWVKDTLNSWQIRKFPAGIVAGVSPAAASYYQSVVRSSEMYLAASEAYAKINSEDSARYYLDAIRLRANSTAGVTTASGSALLDSIYKERRKELCFESLRMFDLLRWKKGVERNDASNANAKTLPYPSNKAIAPLPTLDVSVSGFIQNPEY